MFPLPTSCFLHMIETKVNISVTKFSPVQVRRSELFGIYRDIVHIINKREGFILNHGMYLEDYSFTTIVDSKPQKSVQGLMKPFDYPTWYFLIAWTLIFVAFAKLTRDKVLTPMLAFVLLDQGVSVKGFKKVHIWIFLSWSVLAILINNSYKGKVFELTSSASYPWVPRSVDEVPDSGYVVTSISWYGNSIDRQFVSIIVNKIDEIAHDWKYGLRWLSNMDTYLRLRRQLVWTFRNSVEYLGDLLKHGILYNNRTGS